MASFVSLPNELICEILNLVQPEDLENFAQISRSVYPLAFPFLTKHRALIREYYTLRTTTDHRFITNFLSTIIANPRIGSYVRKAELGHISDSKVVYTREELDNFTTAALDSTCLKKPSEEEVLDEKDFWFNKIENGNDDILLAILLPLLPNLAVLSANADRARQLEWYDKAIEQAAFTSNPILRKLAQFRLESSSRYGFHLCEIQKLSALPSARTITALRACGDFVHEISPDTVSGVTHLKLWESCVDSKALYEFLRGFVNLQSFTYSHHYAVGQPDAFLIRASLLAHCKSTLQSLTLLDNSCSCTEFMGSLRGFKALKELYTEWYFLRPTRDTCRLQLNEYLPASLVRLKIHDCRSRRQSDYERVIKGAQYAKEHHLQKLKWLIFGGVMVRSSLETVDRSLRKTCLNMGITLIFSPYEPKSGD